MSEETKEPQEVLVETDDPTPAPKIFTREDIVRHVNVAVALPKLYPDYEPWEFKLRLKLSAEAEERRQQYLALAASQQTVKVPDQVLDEICDLLIALPKGFGDLKDNGQGPGPSFREYVETSSSKARELLNTIVEGADNLYWASISPREFRK